VPQASVTFFHHRRSQLKAAQPETPPTIFWFLDRFGLAQALPLDGTRQNSRRTPNEMSEMLE
jgi:hypothetical protein